MSARGVLLIVSAASIVAAAGCSGDAGAAAAPAASSAAATAAAGNPAAATAQTPAGRAAAGGIELGTSGVAELAADFDRRCRTESTESAGCEALRSLLVAKLTLSLRELEHSKDQRATGLALEALDLGDEPEVLIAACRVLGHFPETPNLAARISRLVLESRYLEVQKMAATVLIGNPIASVQELGRLWTDNHAEIHWDGPYAEYPPLPKHYPSIGFPKYAGAEWFSPADSDRSVGWSTTADAAVVAKWYGDTLHSEVMGWEKWYETSSQQGMLMVQASVDRAKMARMQQLLDRLMKGDQTANDELEKLKTEMDQQNAEMSKAIDRSIQRGAALSQELAMNARWIVAQKKGERISRLVVVFPVPSIQRTAIKEVWDLSDYPSAWPEPKKVRGQ